MKTTNLDSSKAFTFVDVLVGISLMLIIFISIFGVFQLASKSLPFPRTR